MERAATIIKDSYLEIGVQDAALPIDPGEMQAAIRAMNRFVSSFEGMGAFLGYTPIKSASDFVTIPDYAVDWLTMGLAMRLAPQNDMTVSPELRLNYRAAYKPVKAKMTRIREPNLPVHFPTGMANRFYTHDYGNTRDEPAFLSAYLLPAITSSTTYSDIGTWLHSEKSLFNLINEEIEYTGDDRLRFALRLNASLLAPNNTNVTLALSLRSKSASDYTILTDTERSVNLQGGSLNSQEYIYSLVLDKGDRFKLMQKNTGMFSIERALLDVKAA